MTPLDLQFRLDDLTEEPRAFVGALSVQSLDEVLTGLLGELGYRTSGPAEATGTVYKVGRDIFVDASVRVRVGYDCVRCLEALSLDVEARAQHLLVPGKREVSLDDEVSLDHESEGEGEDDLECYEGDAIDLMPLLREDVLLEMPMNPSCVEALGAPCARFEPVLSAGPAAPSADDAVDPRWAPLLELKKKLT